MCPPPTQVVLKRLLASRARHKQERDRDDPGGLDTTSYEEFWDAARDRRAHGQSPDSYADDAEEPHGEDVDLDYEGWGSSGFSSSGDRGGGEAREGADGLEVGRRDWERVSQQRRPRRVAPGIRREYAPASGDVGGRVPGRGFAERRGILWEGAQEPSDSAWRGL